MDAVPEASEATEYGTVPQYPIESVDNALKVLLLLGQQPKLRLTDVSEYLGVASSTAHRLLSMLAFRGFVRQESATRTYLPGPTLDNLAFSVLRQLDVRNRARPVLERLNVELHETVHLGRLEKSDVHFIDSIESTQALRVGSRLGRVMPAHCTSTGKALLSTLTDDEVRRLYPHESLVQLTAKSIDTRTRLLTVLAEVRRRGYASSQEESEVGVSSIAVAVQGSRLPRLAVNASVPRSRLTPTSEKTIRTRLTEAAVEIDSLLL